jgi:hypothetical protein
VAIASSELRERQLAARHVEYHGILQSGAFAAASVFAFSNIP